MSDESDVKAFELLTRVETFSEETGHSVTELSLEYIPECGYIPVEQFCLEHLERLEQFLRDAFSAMEERGHTRLTSEPPTVRALRPSDLKRGEINAFIGLVSAGGAVRTDQLKQNLLLAEVVVLLLIANKIIGVGAIKSMRPRYVSSISRKSGFELPADARELGYIAVSSAFRGQGLSKLIVGALTRLYPGDLFATTSNRRMQKVLSEYEFNLAGNTWPSATTNNAPVSLWVRCGVTALRDETGAPPIAC